jgi:hypothetical protein
VVPSTGSNTIGTAWSNFTLGPTCGTAVYSVTSAKKFTLGKTTTMEAYFSLTTLGSCTTTLTINIPLPANSAFVLNLVSSFNANMGACFGTSGNTTATCNIFGQSSFGPNDSPLIISGTYENQ